MIRELGNSSKQFTWVDVVDPTEKELREISKQFQLHEYSLLDCLDPDHLPKRELMGETNFILNRFLTGVTNPQADSIPQISNKLAIFHHPEFLITVHKEPVPFLQGQPDTTLIQCKTPA